MPSNSEARIFPLSIFPLTNGTTNGSSRFVTTASASIRSTPNASLSFSSVCIRMLNIPVLVSVCPSAKRLWSATAGAFGWNLSWARARLFTSRCRSETWRHDVTGERHEHHESTITVFLEHGHRGRRTSMTAAEIMKPVEILLVEDNPGDVRLTKEALKEAKVINNLTELKDGVEALAFLRQQGPYGAAVIPHLILLDLNLPKKDGREVLAEIKADEKLKRIPVVVLTTSQDEQDVFKSYNLHANCYVTKPVDLEQFMTVVKSIEDFWLGIVMLPKHGAIRRQG